MKSLISVTLILMLGLAWGLNFSLMKFAATSGISFSLLATLIILGNLVIFASACVVSTGRLRLPFSSWMFFAACGVLGYILPFFLELFSVPRIGAGTLALVVALAPIMTLILSSLSGSEKLSSGRTIGIVLGFISVLPLILQDISELREALGLGLVVGLAVPMTYALYHTLIDRCWPAKINPSEVAFGETLAATFLMVPVYILWPGIEPFATDSVPLSAYWIVGALLVFSAIEVWLYYKIMRMGGAVYVSQSGYVAVFAGVLWGLVFFGETVSIWIGVSIALVISALFFVSPKARDETNPP